MDGEGTDNWWGSYRDADCDGGSPRRRDPSLIDSFYLESKGGRHAHGSQALKVQGLQHSQLPRDGVQRKQLPGRFSFDAICDVREEVRVHRLGEGRGAGE